MNKLYLLVSFVCMSAFCSAQTLSEIQGEMDTSPYEGQSVTFNAKVTEYFGDIWYMQDDFGEWNGVMVHEPDLLVPANPPWWNEPRQPEVGDELTITGTVMEVNGNTQIMDATLVEQTEFWLATPAGTQTTAMETQNEALEGTRVRLIGFTVVTAPNAEEEWNVTDGIAEITCIGIDDEAYPFPGDVYDIYGAIREESAVYKVHVGDIDVVSLSVESQEETQLSISPNPLTDVSKVESAYVINRYEIYNSAGQLVRSDRVGAQVFSLEKANLAVGQYTLRIIGASDQASSTLIVE